MERLLRAADLPVDDTGPAADLASACAQFNGIYYPNPRYIQAGTLMTLVIPVVLFIIFQRVFTRGIVITGVEK